MAMGLREDALAAAEAAAEARVTAARATLADLLDPADVAALTVADANSQVVVFTDGAGLFLSVCDAVTPAKVHRVTGEAGNWTKAGEVSSLQTLGRILADESEST